MKPRHVFWGLLLVTLGTLILVSNFAIVNLDLSGLWKLWPLVLVLWGISFIINKNFVKVAFAGIIAIVLALSIYSAGQSLFNICDKDIDFVFTNDEYYDYSDTTRYVESFEKNIKNAKLNIDAGAGSFNIIDPTSDLFSMLARGTKNNYTVTRYDSQNETSIDVKMKKTKIKLRKGKFKNKIEMSLNSQPVWDMIVDIGAASIDFDLSPYKVKKLNFDMGAASLELKLGDKYPETYFYLDAGASSIKILVPDSSGCEIKTDVSVSSKHFRGFEKIHKDLYRTDNFETAKNKIYINLDAGVSSIEVNRYSGDW